MKLQVGQEQSVSILAKEKWNDTGIELEPGSYSMTADGQWFDASIRSGPDGYDSPNLILKLFEPLRRVRPARWFALMGSTVPDNSQAFVIGRGYTRDEKTGGTLLCFANDVSFMYATTAARLH
jgi:hypothetical protein